MNFEVMESGESSGPATSKPCVLGKSLNAKIEKTHALHRLL